MTEFTVQRQPAKRPRLHLYDSEFPERVKDPDKRHVVLVERGRIDVVADHAATGVFSEGSAYYQRGEILVRMVVGADAAKRRHGPAAPLLVQATAAMLYDDLERTCRFVSRSVNPDSGEVRTRIVACPKPLPGVMLGRAGRLPVPVVRGIVEVPLLHGDGEMVCSGYDPRAGVVVVAPGDWPAVPDKPTAEQAHDALALIDTVLSGFPFVSDIDRSVTIAALLSALLRATLPSCPAFAWSAPVRGSGKSKLADVVAVIATGRTAPAMTWPPQEDESEKRLGAAVMAGDAVILLDNIETALRGACLNSLLTQPTVSLRMLGRSQLLRLSAAVLVLATGNNLVLLGDLSRRFLVAHLDPHTERPELRRFDFDPVVKATAERGALVAALHTIARWGAGKETGLPPLGGFEAWSRRVRDPLVALGLPDCCVVLEQLHQADPERESALEVLIEWRRAFDETATTVATAIRTAATLAADKDPSLRDALDAVAGGPGGINARRLGRYLLRIRDRVFGDMVMSQSRDLIGNVASWAVKSQPPVNRVTRVSSIREENKEDIERGAETEPETRVTRSDAAGDYLAAQQGGEL